MGRTRAFARVNRRLLTAAAVVMLAASAATLRLADHAAATAPDEPQLVQVSSTSLHPGQTVQRYHMTVTNIGAPTDVVVPAPVPAAAITGASTDAGSYADGEWYIGVLETGQTASLDLTAEN